ncbi:multidrug resistance-associated ABC transporter [Fomitiporia mediterranea MF3/22]|uniref:Multidrug resistance-associated ABC transporter n=1 Tax=Fomitiporia mediterranea (strain MF3/22) TaxID=694068 RepID=R7SHK7_FOMME|nr:multidrug resistance-associated ABC transporter [Fomitiporia mediterranea MF3/22]EJC97742.1 multidrug resistance-associated ABC transporter [Fomitiporia mediterranea MF3/22]
MFALHLEVGIALCCCAVISTITFLLQTRPKEGQIQLLSDDDDDVLGGSVETTDPFHVTGPEEVIDGYPVDEKRFWAKIRLRKLALSWTAAALLAVQTGVFVWSLTTHKNSRDVASGALHVAFSVHTFILTVASIKLSDQYWHRRITVHLALLSTTAFVLFMTATILLPQLAWERPRRIGWYIALTLWLIMFWLSVRMKRGPAMHFSPELVYPNKIIKHADEPGEVMDKNVCDDVNSSSWEAILFSYTTRIVKLGYLSQNLEIGDLPLLSADMRAATIFAQMKAVCRRYRIRTARPGSGWQLAYQLLRANTRKLSYLISLILVVSVLFYGPMFFLERLVAYLETDTSRQDPQQGWVYCAGLFASSVLLALVTERLWSLALTDLQIKIRIQLNSLLFAKTLRRKDVVSTGIGLDKELDASFKRNTSGAGEEFSSKVQIMNLMTIDVDRVAEFVWHFYTLIDGPIEIAVGTAFLYQLMGVSCFFGLAVTCLFLPMNNYTGKFVVRIQENLMRTRDERVSLMNEALGAIRMLKFMAWERSFEARILKIRERELKYQQLNYILQMIFVSIWNLSPLLVTLVSFWHFAVVRQQPLTPSVAFTSIAIFSKLKFALNAIPGTMVKTLQSFVSIRRIEEYLSSSEVGHVDPLDGLQCPIAFRSAIVTWPQERVDQSSAALSAFSTPRRIFTLIDITLDFPVGEMSLICGKLGSGKTLLLQALLGEADVLVGRVSCPRSPPNTIGSFSGIIPPPENWIVNGTCAYVSQTTWLQNATIRENILFNLPFVEERYRKAVEACALIEDFAILEDGDESEIGERGITLSGGQKARVSLARAIYSRASVLVLDDVLSAVDSHTALHLYYKCLKGELAHGRTIILASHHIQLCAPGAKYVVALDNGRISFAGTPEEFQQSGVAAGLLQSEQSENKEGNRKRSERRTSSVGPSTPMADGKDLAVGATAHTKVSASEDVDTGSAEKKGPRKLVEDEKRAVGHIGKEVWKAYFCSIGNWSYWIIFILSFLLAAASPIAENGWLSHWSGLVEKHQDFKDPMHYISIYALLVDLTSLQGLVFATLRWFVLYRGSIFASRALYKKLLETVLFASLRFHDTVSRGRLLNRFEKDMEVIDSSLPDDFGNTLIFFTTACAAIATITYVGGPRFFAATLILGVFYYNVAKVYGKCCRDLRRLDSVSRSPLYSIYSETISGVPVLRAFGAGSKFMHDMLNCVNANANPYFWLWKVNRWVSTRVNLLSSVLAGVTGVIALVDPSIDASLAGFTLVFATKVTQDLQRFVQLEQSMVAVERVKEYSDLPKEGPEFIAPRPPESWPSKGSVDCRNLVIRYAPDLPAVLHNLTFKVHAGEKVGILGRTGSGKSTLALSFFRFVEASGGRILVDGVDIAKIGLTDLRSKLTIIPQDPIILSGTLRSTLDVFDEYMDAEIFEALRRVHLVPSTRETVLHEINENIFCNLDTPVSEGGENFSAGQKQLLCLARAILKRSKLLIMDEATASVDYATDRLIGRTIRQEFADSTMLTIAHRLRTVIDYSRVMILDQGRIVEYDRPGTLLSDPSSYFYSLCEAEGEEEFNMLKKIAGVI